MKEAKPNYTYHAKLLRVIDGDTIEVFLDLGHDIWVKRKLRILDLDTPEMRIKEQRERAIEAKEYLQANISEDLTVRTIETDSFGRWLSDVWYQKDGETILLSEDMKNQGHSKIIS